MHFDHLDAVKFGDADDLNEVRSNVIRALIRDNPDEAAALIDVDGQREWVLHFAALGVSTGT